MTRSTLARYAVLAALTFGGTTTGFAQDAETEAWLELGQSAELSDAWRLNVGQDVRWDQDVGRLHEVMPSLGLSYRDLDAVRLDVGYRLEASQTPDEWLIAHRLHVDARTKRDLGAVDVSYRLRLQTIGGDEGRTSTARQRVRLSLDRLGDWTPYVDAELFVGLDSDAMKLRSRVGLDYDLGAHEVGVFYMAAQPLGENEGHRHDIVGVSYGVGF